VTSAPGVHGAVNLLATLEDGRFTQAVVHAAVEQLEREGILIERFTHAPENILAWIDAEFGGTWSTEVAAASICVARDAGGPIGFAAFDARGLRFGWLRAWRTRPDVGVFGPFGVVRGARGTGVGKVLLRFALFSLRERGYAAALIPMVSGDALIAYYEREAGARIVESIDVAAGGRRWRTTILASGNGSNFQAIVDASRTPDRPLPLDVQALICNRAGAFVLERAARALVPGNLVAWNRQLGSRDTYDARVLRAVEETRPDLVLLLGWMHVLPPDFVARFPEALNVHPAFLPLDARRDAVTMPDGTVIPAFRGPKAVDDAFAAGVFWGGASVHRLGVAVDRGEVLARAPLRREPQETKEQFFTRLHALEHRVMHAAIRRWSYERAEDIASAIN